MMSGPDEGPKGKVMFILVVHIPLEARLIFLALPVPWQPHRQAPEHL